MEDKISVCCKCGNICKRGEYLEDENYPEGYVGEYLSDCCGTSIIDFDSIKEVILRKLET